MSYLVPSSRSCEASTVASTWLTPSSVNCLAALTEDHTTLVHWFRSFESGKGWGIKVLVSFIIIQSINTSQCISVNWFLPSRVASTVRFSIVFQRVNNVSDNRLPVPFHCANEFFCVNEFSNRQKMEQHFSYKKGRNLCCEQSAVASWWRISSRRDCFQRHIFGIHVTLDLVCLCWVNHLTWHTRASWPYSGRTTGHRT